MSLMDKIRGWLGMGKKDKTGEKKT